MTTWLITGANRGIGLEFARQLAARGDVVIATSRGDAGELATLGVRVERLDVTDDASVAALVESLGDVAIDRLVNNAGIMARVSSLAEVDFRQASAVFETNVLGAMRVARALLPHVRRGDGKRIINVSSILASITENYGGGMYSYRASKAALNMFTSSLAIEFEPDQICCVAIDPGWVRTDMGGPRASLTPQSSVADMVALIDGLTMEHTGSYLSRTGERLPW